MIVSRRIDPQALRQDGDHHARLHPSWTPETAVFCVHCQWPVTLLPYHSAEFEDIIYITRHGDPGNEIHVVYPQAVWVTDEGLRRHVEGCTASNVKVGTLQERPLHEVFRRKVCRICANLLDQEEIEQAA